MRHTKEFISKAGSIVMPINLPLSTLNLRGDERGVTGILRSEKGIALAFVLILALICLAIVATLMFLVTQGTRFSGFNKRYETAREAGHGGTEVIRALIKTQGALSDEMKNFFINAGNPLKSSSTKPQDTFPSAPDGCNCNKYNEDELYTTKLDNCLCQKLCFPTLKPDGNPNWVLNDGTTCDGAMDPASNYDLKFQLAGFGRNYDVFGKIVDTSVGNTDRSGTNLGGCGVTDDNCSPKAPPDPWLYTIEITAQDQDLTLNPNTSGLRERGRLSVLYAY